MKDLFQIFDLEEVTAQNVSNTNDIKVLLSCCNSLDALRELWNNLKKAGKFDKLNRKELTEIVNLKEKLKKQL